MIRNFMYIKINLDRPQYQLSVYWLKFQLRDYLANFNIVPCGEETKRPVFFKKMIESINIFKNLYLKWSCLENERRNKLCIQKNMTRQNKLVFKPVEKNFLNNFKLLTSKFIYNQFLLEYRNVPKLSFAFSLGEEKDIFTSLHKNIVQPNIIAVNYKVMLNGLPINAKFKNRYEKKMLSMQQGC